MHRRRIDVDGVELSVDAAATTPPRRAPRARSASQDGAALGKMSPRRRRAAAETRQALVAWLAVLALLISCSFLAAYVRHLRGGDAVGGGGGGARPAEALAGAARGDAEAVPRLGAPPRLEAPLAGVAHFTAALPHPTKALPPPPPPEAPGGGAVVAGSSFRWRFTRRVNRGAHGEVWRGEHAATGGAFVLKRMFLEKGGHVREAAARELHGRGVVHRDLKLSNVAVALGDDGALRVAVIDLSSVVARGGRGLFGDFGPSREEETVEYMPPEVLFADEDTFYAPAPAYDAWSLGVLLLELLLGTRQALTVDQRTRRALAGDAAVALGGSTACRVSGEPSGSGSCRVYAAAKRPGAFCVYDASTLPGCLSTHALPRRPAVRFCGVKGRRETIEDHYAVAYRENFTLWGVFDGHEGREAARYAAHALPRLLEESRPPRRWAASRRVRAADAGFAALGRDRLGTRRRSGTTATVAAVADNGALLVANVGDFAVLCCRPCCGADGRAVDASYDHVAADAAEAARIVALGGAVDASGAVPRVEGRVVVTRSIGNRDLAKYLVPEPHVFVAESAAYEFLILATDGLWDTTSSDGASQDNIGVCVIDLRNRSA
ncbi:cyclin-dependent protein serine/threonine kinase [Aureococcus anophagefferens]|nr:cyclin-dependent protein serine/threonine kinase [Aureococcus anophagefferens]